MELRDRNFIKKADLPDTKAPDLNPGQALAWAMHTQEEAENSKEHKKIWEEIKNKYTYLLGRVNGKASRVFYPGIVEEKTVSADLHLPLDHSRYLITGSVILSGEEARTWGVYDIDSQNNFLFCMDGTGFYVLSVTAPLRNLQIDQIASVFSANGTMPEHPDLTDAYLVAVAI